MIDRGCHRDSGSKLVPIEVWADKGWGAEDVLVLIQISFNPSSPSLCPSITHPPPSPIPLPPAPAYILSLHPPITCYPKGVIQAGSLERNGLKREAELLSVFLSSSHPVCVCVCVRACVCVCAEVKYSLCGVCEAVCQEGMGGKGGSRWTASLLSVVLCPNLLFPSFCLYLFSASLSLLSPPQSFLPSRRPLFPPLFPSSSSLFHPLLSHSRWQRGAAAAAATEQKPECKQEMGRGEKGVVEREGGGEKRWGSGIWRAWLRGPLWGSVCACGSVVNREGGGGGRVQKMPIKTEIWL